MRKNVGVFLVFTFLLTFGSTVKAADVSSSWTGLGDGHNWSDALNWNPGLPSGTGTATIDNSYTVDLDASQSVGIVLLATGTAGNATLNITSGANLTIYKSSSTELFGISRIAGGIGTVNHEDGTVRVYRGNGAGEVRLSGVADATSYYNLSGTGVLDVEVLNKGDKSRPAYFNATGGTLVARNLINKFGLINDGYTGFLQGQATLEVGAIDTVAAIGFGNSSNTMDYTVGNGVDKYGAMVFDIDSASSFDKILQYGNVANTLGASLIIRLLPGYTPDVGTTFDVWTFGDKTKAGSGAFASITANWTATWIDTNADLTTDTLQVKYIPEPATIALFGLGLLALRRNKK